MDDLRLAARPGAASDADVLDEADPHAGDDAAWADDEQAAALVVGSPSSPLRFWQGLLLGLLLSAAAWCVLAAAAFGLRALLN